MSTIVANLKSKWENTIVARVQWVIDGKNETEMVFLQDIVVVSYTIFQMSMHVILLSKAEPQPVIYNGK